MNSTRDAEDILDEIEAALRASGSWLSADAIFEATDPATSRDEFDEALKSLVRSGAVVAVGDDDGSRYQLGVEGRPPPEPNAAPAPPPPPSIKPGTMKAKALEQFATCGNDGLTATDLADAMGCGRKQAENQITWLRRDGLIEVAGERDRSKVYQIAQGVTPRKRAARKPAKPKPSEPPPAPEAPVQPAHAEPSEQCPTRFAVWDDGRVEIEQGETRLTLASTDAQRLRRHIERIADAAA